MKTKTPRGERIREAQKRSTDDTTPTKEGAMAKNSTHVASVQNFTGRPITGGLLWRRRHKLMTIGDRIRERVPDWRMRQEVRT
jgi:hypothetical protein